VTWGITISGIGTEKEFKREERIKASVLLQTFEITMTPLPDPRHKIGHCGEDQSLVQMISSLKNLVHRFGAQRRYIVLGWAAYINKEETNLEVKLRSACPNCQQKNQILSAACPTATYLDLVTLSRSGSGTNTIGH